MTERELEERHIQAFASRVSDGDPGSNVSVLIVTRDGRRLRWPLDAARGLSLENSEA